MMATMLLLGILLFLVLQALEVRRRLRDPDILTPALFWRRILTGVAFEVVLLMWLVGDHLTGHQPPLVRLAYWTAVLLLAIAAAFSTLRDWADVSRQYNRHRAELLRGSGPDLSEDGASRSGPAANGSRASG